MLHVMSLSVHTQLKFFPIVKFMHPNIKMQITFYFVL